MDNKLKKDLINANETFLVSLANKGIYKRACKDIDGMMLISREEDNAVVVDISGETVTVKSPLNECSCSCISRTVCRHIVGAILLLKNSLTEEDFADICVEEQEKSEPVPETVEETPTAEEETEKSLSADEIRKINECAVHCLEMLGDILKRGLVRIPETAPENMEISAVRCHAVRMADAERAMRDLSTRLSDCLARRASFSTEFFTDKMCRTVSMLEKLCRQDITPDILGTFRQDYKLYKGYLTLIPIGERTVSGGDYEGEIYYFLNPDAQENPFLTVSDLRPTFYETKRHILNKITPWGMITTLDTMMRRKIILANAKISEGKISTSKETVVAMNSSLDLDCEEIRSRIYCDFRQALIELYEKNPQNETERLMFIHPQRCVSAGFDKHTQQYTLIIEDGAGFQAFMRVKYREETKALVELVEKIGQKMLDNPEKDYTILASARIEKNEFVLFPIEIYDFISVPEYEEYWLPDEYETTAGNLKYAESVMEIIEEIESNVQLMIQCGMQSGMDRKLSDKCFNYGLKGLSRLVTDFVQSVESYRHDTKADIRQILNLMTVIQQYITTARKRLEIILTLGGKNK